MTWDETATVCDRLYDYAERFGRLDWLPQIARRIRLPEPAGGWTTTQAAWALAREGVTWADICEMKS